MKSIFLKTILVTSFFLVLTSVSLWWPPELNLSSRGHLAQVGAGLAPERTIGSTDRVLIEYPSYSTIQATSYLADGTRESITVLAEVKQFLKDHIDLIITGPNDYADNQIVLRYQQLNGVYESHTALYSLAENDENNFVHGRGLAQTKNNRLIHRSYSTPGDPQYLTNPSTAWRDNFIAFHQQTLPTNPRWDGVFLDNTLGQIITGYSYGNAGARYLRHVVDEPYALEAGADHIVADPNYLIHIPTSPYYTFENIITVYDQPGGVGTDYYGGTYDENNINLNAPLAEPKTLYASYYVLDQPEQALIDNWGPNTEATLAAVKTALTDKLVTYNGIVQSWPEDDGFPAVSDGGMVEHFIYAPWDPITRAPPTKSDWLFFVDELEEVSADRIYMAQGGIVANIASSTEEAEMKEKAMFAFASFLLGKGEYGYFHFAIRDILGAYQSFSHFAYWDAPLGEALEAYHTRTDNSLIYQREFEHLIALVNPGTSTTTLTLIPNDYEAYWDKSGVRRLTVDDLANIQLEPGGAILLMKKAVTPAVNPAPVSTSRSTSGSRRRTISLPELSFTTLSPAKVKNVFAPLTALFAPGQTGTHVQQLQQMLAQDPTIYNGGDPEGFYGPETVEAVKKFQTKYGLLNQGSPETNGFGFAGPMTRAKLNELYAGTAEVAERIRVIQEQLIEIISQLTKLIAERNR